MKTDETLASKLIALLPHLDERARRLAARAPQKSRHAVGDYAPAACHAFCGDGAPPKFATLEGRPSTGSGLRGSGGEAPPDCCAYGLIERGGRGHRRSQAAPSRAGPRRNAVDPVFRRLHRGFKATHQRPGVDRHNPPPPLLSGLLFAPAPYAEPLR